jgi:predicted DNA-binding transcriptional regulator YafY
MRGALSLHQHRESLGRLLTIARGLAGRRRVWMRYCAADGDETEREVDPLALSWRGERWLLACWCHRRNAFRLFRVERIARARVLRQASDVSRAPPGFDPRFFASVGYLEPGGPSPVLATVRLSDPLDRFASALFPAALFERSSERSVLCHMRATDLAVLARLVIALGDRATLVHPGSALEILRAVRPVPPS